MKYTRNTTNNESSKEMKKKKGKKIWEIQLKDLDRKSVV